MGSKVETLLIAANKIELNVVSKKIRSMQKEWETLWKEEKIRETLKNNKNMKD